MDFQRKPKLIAFDLDGTLWPFAVGITLDGPFLMDKNGKVVNDNNESVQPYEQVHAKLQKLHRDGYVLAVVSRAEDPEGAKQLLKLFKWDEYFTYKVIDPGPKIDHFETLKKSSGIDYSDMIYFDNEEINKIRVGAIGVYTVVVKDGVTEKLVDEGLGEFSDHLCL